jgi:hypothetical protein
VHLVGVIIRITHLLAVENAEKDFPTDIKYWTLPPGINSWSDAYIYRIITSYMVSLLILSDVTYSTLRTNVLVWTLYQQAMAVVVVSQWSCPGASREGIFQTGFILNLPLFSFTHRPLYSGGKCPGTYWIWVVWARKLLRALWRRDKFSPMPGIEPARSLVTIPTEISSQSVLNICRLIRI